MQITVTPIKKGQCELSYIYKKQKKCETFIYIYRNPDTLHKGRQFDSRFYSQKARHFRISWYGRRITSYPK